jgi:dihydroorotase
VAYGIVGLETLLPLSLELHHNRHLELIEVLRRLTVNPARILGLEVGRLTPGMPADLILFDPDLPWRVDTDRFRSKSKNAPFDGRPVQGHAVQTVVDGRTIFAREG